MPRNTNWFATYLRETRERRGWSQQQVADAGGPYRQLLATMENNDEPELRPGALDMIDRAYAWPYGYTQALAELGEYADDSERALPDALRGGERDGAAMIDYPGQDPPDVAWKTFSGIYDKPDSGGARHFSPIGFDVDSGRVSYLGGPTLTNVAFAHLHSMILARHGVTTIDINVTDAKSLDVVAKDYADGHMPDGVAQHPMKRYRIGATEPDYAAAIVMDPLSEITTLSEAKILADKLLTISPQVPTSVMRAAFTFLAIVAFGEDPLVTLTQLKRGGTDPSARDFAERFTKFWDDFYDPTKAGPDLARPDRAACDLLAGTQASRDTTMQINIGGYQGQRPHPRYTLPHTVTPGQVTGGDDPAVIFYDSNVIPELPVVQSLMWPAEALTFYRADLAPGNVNRIWPQLGKFPHNRIGIIDANDRDVLNQHKPYELATLTNYIAGPNGGQAIYCDAGQAQRIWIPPR
ncbi:helix-turn-helix domain-containing protein [Mycolicibacterium fortuitum]|uniref:helix-turn-helix domain-containing protein n=1 Tax=Mycolicibacterium fortuitum TaxID=1766 RepID=UPI001CDD38B2|nr:helix-turn-helix transcriptional regulator [Mycolicibacterium fortuitum]UBV17762.1 helix-turn-helix domain-containing protein [Mycolicibacterium fortuitum]